MKIDHVQLNVSNLRISVDFYQRIIGLRVIKNESNEKYVTLGCPDSVSGDPLPMLILHEYSDKDNSNELEFNSSSNSSGLYHFALLLSERKFLGSFYNYIKENLEPMHYVGAADHAVSESLYISDPDLNGIEIYCDRPSASWLWKNDKVLMKTDPLNTRSLIEEANSEVWKECPNGTSIGHIHLSETDLDKAKIFYCDVMGLNLTSSYPGAYFFAWGGYHHRIATNNWNLQDGFIRSQGLGLDHFAIKVNSIYNDDISSIKVNWQNYFKRLGTQCISTLSGPDQKFRDTFYVHDLNNIKIQFIFD
jgi:catechol 2,3-dioxygenase